MTQTTRVLVALASNLVYLQRPSQSVAFSRVLVRQSRSYCYRMSSWTDASGSSQRAIDVVFRSVLNTLPKQLVSALNRMGLSDPGVLLHYTRSSQEDLARKGLGMVSVLPIDIDITRISHMSGISAHLSPIVPSIWTLLLRAFAIRAKRPWESTFRLTSSTN